jgi:hypothetical protein
VGVHITRYLCLPLLTLLIAHARHYGAPPVSEFWLLVQSLDDMARRWRGMRVGDQVQSTSLFQRLAGRLRTLQANSQLNPSQNNTVSAPLYEPTDGVREPYTREWVTPEEMSTYMERARADLTTATLLDSTKAPFTLDDEALHHSASQVLNLYEETGPVSVLPWGIPDNVDLSEPGIDNESLLAISETLTSQDFTSIDRIVTFENGMLGSFF